MLFQFVYIKNAGLFYTRRTGNVIAIKRFVNTYQVVCIKQFSLIRFNDKSVFNFEGKCYAPYSVITSCEDEFSV